MCLPAFLSGFFACRVQSGGQDLACILCGYEEEMREMFQTCNQVWRVGRTASRLLDCTRDDSKTVRQTDRQADRPKGRQTDRQTAYYRLQQAAPTQPASRIDRTCSLVGSRCYTAIDSREVVPHTHSHTRVHTNMHTHSTGLGWTLQVE